VLLVLVGSVSQFAETIEKHSPRQGISSLAFVEASLNAPTQFNVAQKIESEDRSLKPSQQPLLSRRVMRRFWTTLKSVSARLKSALV
jgi:hypothetical protein